MFRSQAVLIDRQNHRLRHKDLAVTLQYLLVLPIVVTPPRHHNGLHDLQLGLLSGLAMLI